MLENPLIVPVLEILSEADAAITEHQLMKTLEQDDEHFSELAESQNLALFQKHFLIMNALYQLQKQLLDEKVFLHISPLAIYSQRRLCQCSHWQRLIVMSICAVTTLIGKTFSKPLNTMLVNYWINSGSCILCRKKRRVLTRHWICQ